MPDKPPTLIDGKAIAQAIKIELATEVAEMLDSGTDAPHLAAVLVGEDQASVTYVNNKEKACREVGFISSVYRLPENVTQRQLTDVVDFLNDDEEIDGFIVQLPLPPGIDMQAVIERIHPSKDVDGFHPVNIGRMVQGIPCYLPATPMGIMTLIERYNIETSGKHCVVLGRSQIVGTPVSILMSRKAAHANATVTLCHSQTHELSSICRQADILIAAIGQPHFVKADMIREGAVVIDVGIHRIPAPETKSGTRLIGDVDFLEVAPKCSYITPVPGGVGPMTIMSLLTNTLKAAKRQIYK